jgi:hypothetical protein
MEININIYRDTCMAEDFWLLITQKAIYDTIFRDVNVIDIIYIELESSSHQKKCILR